METGTTKRERERERGARRKEYRKGERKEAAEGREKNYETQKKLAGGRFGAGKQAAEIDGLVGRADPDGRSGQAPQVTVLFTQWAAPDMAI